MEASALMTGEWWESQRPQVMDPGLGGGEVEALQGELRRRGEEARGWVLFSTSGTSGRRKWVIQTRESLRWSARAVIGHLGLRSEDCLGLALPAFHVGGMGVLARAWELRARWVRFSQRWEAGAFACWLREEGVSWSALVPTQVRDLVEGGWLAPEGLRQVVVGGGALAEGVGQRARELGWPILRSYGASETASQVATERRPGEGLRVLENWEVGVELPSGEVCQEGRGRGVMRGGGLFQGYLRWESGDWELEQVGARGWRSEDELELKGGQLKVCGRRDRQVKILGELVDVAALERDWCERLERECWLEVCGDERRGAGLVLWVEAAQEEGGGLAARVEGVEAQRVGFERLVAGWVVPRLRRSGVGKIVGVEEGGQKSAMPGIGKGASAG